MSADTARPGPTRRSAAVLVLTASTLVAGLSVAGAAAPLGAQTTTPTTPGTPSTPSGAAPQSTASTSTTSTSAAPTTTDSAAPTTTVPLPQLRQPGVYVQEQGAAGPQFVAVGTGVPLIIGAATPTRAAPGVAVPISSPSDLDAVVDDPSASLADAVSDVFAAGGDLAMVLAVADEQPSTLAASLVSARNAVGWDLLVVPTLATLSGTEWTNLADAMVQLASQQRAVALLDPPTDAVSAAATDGGAALVAVTNQLRSNAPAAAAVMYSSGLLRGDQPVAAAPSGAGVLAAGDTAEGVWSTPGGTAHPVPGLTPALPVDNPLSTALAGAGITTLRTVAGFGTVLMGNRTLSDGADDELSLVRTLDTIERSIELGLQSYVFAANDATTWSQVVAATSGFLQSMWQQGGLVGAEPSEAFTVAAGVGTTMTGQDVLDGYMIVAVTVQVGDPARPIDLSFTQTMGS